MMYSKEAMCGSIPVFVYGTLRPGEGNWPLLAAHATATTEARLADHALYGLRLGFPYAVAQAGASVHGDLVEIDPRRYGDALADLDRLEGYRRGDTHNHYERRFVTVEANGTRRPAWVYLDSAWARRRLTAAEQITSGDWRARDTQRCA